MKKQPYTLIGALVFTALFAVSTAKAQSANQRLVATIPFAFNAGSQTLPAGKYTVSVTNPASDQRIVQIRSIDGSKSVLLQMYSVNGKTMDGARLVFNCYGDRYFLAQAWTAATDIGLEAPLSRTERGTNRELSSVRKTQSVALSRQR